MTEVPNSAEIFPILLIRSGGLSFYSVKNFFTSKNQHYRENLGNLYELLQAKELLLLMLSNGVVGERSAFQQYYRKLISNIRHDKKRILPTKEFIANNQSEKNRLVAIKEKINRYQSQRTRIQEQQTTFKVVFEEEISRMRTELVSFSKEEVLLSGLALSSHSFIDRLAKYRFKKGSAITKKELQTERTLVEYLSRIITKTSPFSTFTNLSILDLERGQQEAGIRRSTIQLNSHILAYFQECLMLHPAFFRQLLLRANPTLTKSEKVFSFLKNQSNIESISSIEKDVVLELIVEELEEEELFDSLIATLMEAIDADKQDLEHYVLNLIQEGFLEWEWGFSMMHNWLQELIALIDEKEKDSQLDAFLKLLKSLQSNVQHYATADMTTRLDLLKESHKALQDCKTIFPEAPDFKIAKENIFYEDVREDYTIGLQKKDIKPITDSFGSFLQVTSSIQFSTLKREVVDFYNATFQQEEEVRLLAFYEQLYKNKSTFESKKNTDYIALQAKWKEALQNHFQLTDDHNLFVSSDKLQKIAVGFTPTKNEKKSNNSFAAFLQIYQENNSYNAVLNASAPGFGKMMGRFITLFPEAEVEKRIQQQNKSLQPTDEIWAENIDASFANANSHPPLLEMEIDVSNGQHRLTSPNRISLRNLFVCFEKKEGDLVLKDRISGKRVRIFDFGFELQAFRSPMYQLLSCFATPRIVHQPFLQIANTVFEERQRDHTIIRPRIVLDNNLILQRKAWLIPKTQLPIPFDQEEKSTYFFRLLKWQVEKGIPQLVYIKMPKEQPFLEKDKTGAIALKQEVFKPQFIDFEHPLLIQLFAKLARKTISHLMIEEALPKPAQYLNGRVSELVVQLDLKE